MGGRRVGDPEFRAKLYRRLPIEAFSLLRTADQVLFNDLIDYAGLFPPASLSMESAVAEYRSARGGVHSPLLGRFICPASRLEELAGILTATMVAGEAPWPIVSILDGDVAHAAVMTHSFDAEMEPAARIASLEVPLPAAAGDGRAVDEATRLAAPIVKAALSASVVAMPFFEVQAPQGRQRGIENAVAAIAELRGTVRRPLGVKLRCGGPASSAFPEPHQVAAFIATGAAAGLPFKATAGLHHAIRHYDADPGVMRHGFLNLLAAAALASTGAPAAQLVAVIEETDPAAFGVTASGLRWRDTRVAIVDLVRAREQFAAYGSCSFAEPVADLVSLGMVTVS
jgi:hypothetical protein